MDSFTLLVIVIVLAFIFDYINGFHDAANAIATIVATRVLTPFQAVLWAAFFNFMAYFIIIFTTGEFNVGNTIAKTVTEDFISMEVILAGLIAAIFWNLLTWKFGIPSSSSHTLIGGFMGAALTHAYIVTGGDWDIIINGVINAKPIIKIVLFIFLAPAIGFFIAHLLTVLIMWICRKTTPHKADVWFRKLQLVSSALFSLGHGANDAQKVMGIIGAAVIAYHLGLGPDDVYYTLQATTEKTLQEVRFSYFVEHYYWVPVTSFTIIGLGTMSGGWKIVKTMGSKITKVSSLEGVSAESAGAITLFISEHFGIPVSTTHTITGSIIGVGATKRVSAVRWGVTIKLLWAWVLTIPVSGLVACLVYILVNMF